MSSFYVIDYCKKYTFDDLNGLHFNKETTFVSFKDERGNKYKIELYPDFITDGGSVPKIFQGIIPAWSKSNILLNLAYCAHDFCYGSECMARSLADDLLRSLLRDAGFSRFKAGIVCTAVNAFACCHYGRKYDDFNCAAHGKLFVI